MKKEFDLLVFIGRFQIFHKGHAFIIQEAFKKADQVVVLVGSSGQARSLRNPFTFNERKKMINSACDPNRETVWKDHYEQQLYVEQIPDYGYRDLEWTAGVQRKISEMGFSIKKDHKIGLIGHSKDNSSYYLELFPQWGEVACHNYNKINSTEIRESYFQSNSTIQTDDGYNFDSEDVPSESLFFLLNFAETRHFENLVKEYEFTENYQRPHKKYKYAPTFNCTDAIVIQSGHVLMIERKEFPGKGLWALPGGFVEPELTLEENMLKELREETKLKIPEPVLKGSMLGRKTFDMVHRSTRGRTFTEAFFIKLKDDVKLPPVKGGDDAKKAFWVPLGELEESQVFEDHYAIIWKMIHKFS